MWNSRMENAMEHQMEADMMRNEANYMDSRGNHAAAAALRFDSGIEKVEAFGAAINPFSHHHHHHGGGMMGAGMAQMELARESQMMMGGGMGYGYGGGMGVNPGYYPPAGGVYPMGVAPPGQVTTVTEITTSNNGFQPGFMPGAGAYGPGYMGGPGVYPPAGPGFYPPY